MWQILKSELEYNKYVIIGTYTAILVLFIAGLAAGGGFYSVVPNTIVPFFVGFAFLCKTSCSESRERQHCLLPQSRSEYGFTRMILFALFQSGMVLLWVIAYLINIGRTPEGIWMILTTSALVLTFRGVLFIFDDMKSDMPSITRSEGWAPEIIARRVMGFATKLILIVLLIIVVAATEDVGGFTLMDMDVDWQPVVDLRDLLRGPVGALATSAIFMITFYLSANYSLPRRSFASSR